MNATQQEHIIKIKNLVVESKGNQILKGVDLNIPRNKITAILGPSGCGKTTMLKCLNRLTDLSKELNISGEIKFDGKNILSKDNDITQIRQKMGLLSQRPFPLPMSIYANITYGLKLKGIYGKEELDRRVEKNLRQVALWDEVKDRLHSPATRLSIGQQQRLCLARGLAVEPEVILADEPTSALDPLSSNAIEKQFAALRKDYSIVLVTHTLRQAKKLADYVVFMYYGEILEQGPAEEVFNDPKSLMFQSYLQAGVEKMTE